MNVLVVGGAGFIGSHVVYELIRSKNKVIVLDNLSTGNKESIPNEVKFYKGNVLDEKILNQIFKNNKIDVVMHFAAKLIVPESIKKPIEYFENNVYGVLQLLKSMNKHKIKNIVFSSTAAVYGDVQKNKPIDEKELKTPIQPYGQSKLACEWLIESSHKAYGINYAIFRYFNVAGADKLGKIGQSTKGVKEITHLIPVIIEVVNKERDYLKIFGGDYDTKDGTCVRDYIHVSDLAIAHIKGAEYVLKGNSNVFNLGSNKGFSVREVLETTKKTINVNIASKQEARREGDPAFLVASNKKAMKILNWQPKFSLKDIINSDFKWRKNKKF